MSAPAPTYRPSWRQTDGCAPIQSAFPEGTTLEAAQREALRLAAPRGTHIEVHEVRGEGYNAVILQRWRFARGYWSTYTELSVLESVYLEAVAWARALEKRVQVTRATIAALEALGLPPTLRDIKAPQRGSAEWQWVWYDGQATDTVVELSAHATHVQWEARGSSYAWDVRARMLPIDHRYPSGAIHLIDGGIVFPEELAALIRLTALHPPGHHCGPCTYGDCPYHRSNP